MAAKALEEAKRWDDALTIWREEGELARLNARAGEASVPVSERLGRGLAAMLTFETQTAGSFRPVRSRPGAPDSPVPLAGEVLSFSAPLATLQAGAELDSGAVGKGLALDAMVALLRHGGAKAAFLDFGGSSQTALGSPPGDESGWRILLSGLAEGSSHGSLRLRDSSVATSKSGAEDTTPVLDPRTGRAVPLGRQVTVVCASAAQADAWSTALVVLGRPGQPQAVAQGVESLLEDGAGVLASPGFPVDSETE